jgi:hypothetical protein
MPAKKMITLLRFIEQLLVPCNMKGFQPDGFIAPEELARQAVGA